MFGEFYFAQPYYGDAFGPTPITLASLLDIETEVEGVLAGYLSSILGLPVVTSDSNTVLVTPRVEVTCELISDGMNQQTIPSGFNAGLTLYTQKQVRLNFDLVYSPARPQSPNTLLGTLRQVGANYPALKAAFAVNHLYLLAPDSWRQTGGSRVIDRQEKTETTRMQVSTVFFIDPSGFPT